MGFNATPQPTARIIASSDDLKLAYPENSKGIGAVIGRADSPDLISDVRVAAVFRLPRRPRTFPGGAAQSAMGWPPLSCRNAAKCRLP